MLFIENNRTDPFFNLAAEEYFFRESSITDPLFLLWRNDPVVVVGLNQNTLEEINAEVLESEGIKVVRRLTGGGAVYHDPGNLNYTFIVPANLTKSDVQFDFYRFTAPVLKVLAQMGIRAELSGRNDLLVNGRKISGNAQVRSHNRILHHGTLLFETNIDAMVRALNVDSDKFHSKAVSSVYSRVTNIREHLPETSPIRDILVFRDYLCAEIGRNCRTCFHGDNEEPVSAEREVFTNRPFLPEEVMAIERLRTEKYRTWNWNYGSSPPFDFRVSQRFSWGKLEIALKIEKGKIASCTFFGDFFAADDVQVLSRRMLRQPYQRRSLMEIISTEEIQKIFPELSREEFFGLLFREKREIGS